MVYQPDAPVVARIPKHDDCETHIREITVEGVPAVELRDFKPSTQQYGRGYWMRGDRESLALATGAFEELLSLIRATRSGDITGDD